MKKQMLNLGKALNKAEQKLIIGGEKDYFADVCAAGASCTEDMDCVNIGIQCEICVSGGCQMG